MDIVAIMSVEVATVIIGAIVAPFAAAWGQSIYKKFKK